MSAFCQGFLMNLPPGQKIRIHYFPSSNSKFQVSINPSSSGIMANEPDDASLPTPPPGYTFKRFDAPAVSPALADEVVSFLGGFGPHFNGDGAIWGPDYRMRLTVPAGVPASSCDAVATVAVAVASGDIAAHACVLYSSKRPAVGALFHVRAAAVSVGHVGKMLVMPSERVPLVVKTSAQ
jgi:hypothetical protein